MHRIATRFSLIVAVAVISAAKIAAQETPSVAGPNLQPNAGGEEAAVNVVEASCSRYLAQEQRNVGGHFWRRSPHLSDRRGFAARHRYFFPYGKATSGRSVHARNPGGDRLLHQDVHHHAVCASHQPQSNRA